MNPTTMEEFIRWSGFVVSSLFILAVSLSSLH
jgi:hypothetical protein